MPVNDTTVRRSNNRNARDRSGDPWCITCHSRMRKYMIGFWKCVPCGVCCKRERIGGAMFSTSPIFNPWCIVDRKRMSKTVCQQTRRRRFVCAKCKRSVQEVCNSDTPEPTPRRAPGLRRRPIDTGARLLALIEPFVTSYPLDVRDELRSAIALAVLGHTTINGKRMSRNHLNALTVRVIARPILRAQPNHWRFISLDHVISQKGVRLEERLAG